MGDYELIHYGTPGMRWGFRRYQNRDGTLTPAGKKRYAKEMEKLERKEKILKNKARTQAKWDKLESKRREVDELKESLSKKKKSEETKSQPDPKPKKYKSVKDIPDDELNAIVNRMTLEQRYSQLNPEKVSLGRRFAKTVLNDVLRPAAIDIGKAALKNVANKTILKNDKNDNKNNEKKDTKK